MLRRELSSVQATAINMIDMVGIGPFITTAMVVATMGSVQGALLVWTIGMAIAFIDACVWSELGAALPRAGGSYAFLRTSYGHDTWGRLMAFLFVWQTSFQAPLVIASGALGFAKYSAFLLGAPSGVETRLIAAALIVLLVVLLYRRIGAVGNISVVLWTCVIATMAWIIGTGVWSVASGTTDVVQSPLTEMPTQWSLIGVALLPTIYSYLGYYNICHLGAEVRNPERVIPRSMFVSILGIGALYLSMQWAITSVMSVEEIAASPFVVSAFMERVWGQGAAQIATGLVLVVAIASLFSVILGYTRIPYAAAKDGLFFAIFGREHPTKNFPHMSLLILGGVGLIFSVTLTLDDTIKSIITMRVFTQFIAQAGGLMVLRKRLGPDQFPWRMWFYPLPVLVAIAAWLWMFASAGPQKQLVGVVAPLVGVCVYFVLARIRGEWPFKTVTE